MNRYILFCGETYYPRGGASDYAGSAATLDEAKAWGAAIDISDGLAGIGWWNVLDAETGEIVAEDG